MAMLLGAVADDFTGATDLANTLVKEGMRTLQVVGLPAAAFEAHLASGQFKAFDRTVSDWGESKDVRTWLLSGLR